MEPIRKQKDIKSISRLLKSHPRNYLLFILGINNGLRANDLVRLKYHQVEGLKSGAVIKIVESKTGKTNVLVINKSVFRALQLYITEAVFTMLTNKSSRHFWRRKFRLNQAE